MAHVTLVGGAPRGLELEMIATTMPRLMFPSTTIRIRNLDPKAEYRIYLKLTRSSQRFVLREQRWIVPERDFHEREDLEEKMVLNKHRQQTGAFFMKHGVSFENARISFNKVQTKLSVDTMYVRKYFKYQQTILVDRIDPNEGNRSCQVFPIRGGDFVAVSQFESSRMSQYYAIGFENIRQFGKRRQPTLKSTHTLFPMIYMNHPSDYPVSVEGFMIEDPDDVPPTKLSDGAIITRKYGRTYYYPPQQKTMEVAAAVEVKKEEVKS
ncbi:hypothetical protein CAEBREN_11308 [Caenorhabditis brenneri]|uniref:T-box domain-containing protein n=1 Tax=Caenorhabditis brenneri TaxID=135651 RepID=G0P3V1_CAEBE|nr:hypothetical protein CAEBREN_11308 [Caenorhabditis brenneri]